MPARAAVCLLALAMGGLVMGSASPGLAAPLIPDETDAAHAEYTQTVRSGERLGREEHDYAGALAQYDKALAMGPPTPRALSVLLTYRAGALWHLGRSAEALADQDRAVAADRNAFALWARAETLRKLKRYGDSLRDYDAALSIAPGYAPSHAGRGIVLSHLGRIAEAHRAFDRAIALSADSYTFMRRAEFWIGQGKLREAVADYSRMIEIDPADILARVNRATALGQMGAYDEALADCSAALRIKKNDPAIYRIRGFLFEHKGLIDRARADYRRALELAPDDTWTQAALRKVSGG